MSDTATGNRHLEVAEQITRATRLKGLRVLPVPNGREARIVLDGVGTLAYVNQSRNGIRVQVQHGASQERVTVKSVTAAAAAVKSSGRRANGVAR